ncbi:MAG TPA: UDP-N-acetylmuramate dehydrogenase [Caulobacteraceae bacterium]|jgi:UDP-N-acetylmuramate dehydrogenase|nr:UDP-N-acetylmuramate dehydrogenase [Caulobacteraceae bacterium]
MNWRRALGPVRGRIVFDEPLAPYTWLRVGGPADALFLPADEEDLASVLAALPPEVPVTVLGAASNVIVRDGGIRGLVVRLAGKAFGEIAAETADARIIAGAGALDARVARAAARAAVEGLEFFAGIPGSIGGALTMNAGCYGSETANVMQVAWGVDRAGQQRVFTREDVAFGYRRSSSPDGFIWTGAVFQGRHGSAARAEAAIEDITRRREDTQPIHERTGGSTFKNPSSGSAWRLVDEAGWRGRGVGGAIISPLHANFLINTGDATAADLEGLGELIRADVRARFGVQLDWEIRRLGESKA